MNWKKTSAAIISAVFHPLLAPVYGTVLTFCCYRIYAAASRLLLWHTLSSVALYALLLPVGIWMAFYAAKGDRYLLLHNKKDRLWPLLAEGIALSGVALWFFSQRFCRPVTAMLFAEAVLLLAAAFISRGFKISLHAMGGGAAVGFVCCFIVFLADTMLWPLCGTIAAASLLGWARIENKAHTLCEVLWGGALGFVVMAAAFIEVMCRTH